MIYLSAGRLTCYASLFLTLATMKSSRAFDVTTCLLSTSYGTSFDTPSAHFTVTKRLPLLCFAPADGNINISRAGPCAGKLLTYITTAELD